MSTPDAQLLPTIPADPYLRANTGIASRVARSLWGFAWLLLFRPSPRPLHAWRAFLLRLFGARLGPRCHIYPGARIWAPWNLECQDTVAIADAVEIYNPSLVRLGSHCVVSQHAYLCGASHDLRKPGFAMISAPITIGRYAWICARATVQMGVTVGDGAVLGLGAVATRDLHPWLVYAGVPARIIGTRENFS
jgi:putative colanic acid biosynthesis acetyltransferase WcaF